MAVADTAKLIVDLSLKGNFARQMGLNTKALNKFDKDATRAFKAGQQIGTGIKRGAAIAAAGIGFLATNVALGLDSLIELESQTAQTNAVLKSTGGVAGITADEVGRLAEKYEALNATVGDEVIREGENLLLTFTNIRKDAFEPALAAALDMNQALGKGPDGLTSTVKVLGKALNDPTKGLSALSRVGVTFTAEQQKRIKALQKEGDLYGAQSIILEELNKRFGGSFLAGGNTTAGKVAKFTDAIDDLQRTLATALLPVVGNVADALSDLLQDPEIVRGAEVLGEELGKLFSAENVKEGARIVGDVVSAIATAAPTIASGLGTAATVIGKVLSAFQKLPPEVQQLAIGAFAVNKLTGGLITNIAGGIFGALKAMTVQAGVVNVSGGVVNGGGGGVVPGGGKGTSILGAAKLIGALGIAVIAIEKLGEQFGTFQGQVEDAQTGLQQQVNKTSTQDLASTIANLNATSENLRSMGPLDQIISSVFGGGQVTDNFNMAADRILQASSMTEGQLVAARDALANARSIAEGQFLDTSKLDTAIAEVDRRIAVASQKAQRQGERNEKGLSAVKAEAIAAAARAQSQADHARQAVDQTRQTLAQKAQETTRETTRGAQQIRATERSESAAIRSTIRANRPIITVNVAVTANSYSKTVNVNSRSGPPGGSRDTHTGSKQAPP